jgi:hypothetical protein
MSQAKQIQTHKERQNYAADYDHDWPVTSVPRNPEFYQPVPAAHDKGWSHFVDSVKNRNIPWEVVRETIENGEVYEAEGENRYRFLWTCPGTRTTFSLVVELRAEAFAYDDTKHYAVTIYRVQH